MSLLFSFVFHQHYVSDNCCQRQFMKLKSRQHCNWGQRSLNYRIHNPVQSNSKKLYGALIAMYKAEIESRFQVKLHLK